LKDKRPGRCLPPLTGVEASAPSPNGQSPNGAGYLIPRELTRAEAETEFIRFTVEELGDDIRRSESLGTSHKSLWKRRKRHGLLS